MEAVGRLAGGVAHDFNNLLTVILGYCELLLAGCDPADRRHADLDGDPEGRHARRGPHAPAARLQPQADHRADVLDLNVVVSDMRAMLGRLIGEDVNVVLGFEPQLGRVKADRGQIEQIIMNLAVNARDAMPHGGTLTIETANVELDEDYAATHVGVTPGPYVALTVTDTGTGMTPEVQARLFEPFFTTKEVGKGTGLGLATVHGIVAAPAAASASTAKSARARRSRCISRGPLPRRRSTPRRVTASGNEPAARRCSWSRTRPGFASCCEGSCSGRATRCSSPPTRTRRCRLFEAMGPSTCS